MQTSFVTGRGLIYSSGFKFIPAVSKKEIRTRIIGTVTERVSAALGRTQAVGVSTFLESASRNKPKGQYYAFSARPILGRACLTPHCEWSVMSHWRTPYPHIMSLRKLPSVGFVTVRGLNRFLAKLRQRIRKRLHQSLDFLLLPKRR